MCTANGELSELLSGQMSCGKGESKASESLSSHGPHADRLALRLLAVCLGFGPMGLSRVETLQL